MLELHLTTCIVLLCAALSNSVGLHNETMEIVRILYLDHETMIYRYIPKMRKQCNPQ